MTRSPARPEYDAVVGLLPTGDLPTFMFGVVKLTYRVDDARLQLAEPEPLFGDMRDESLQPRMPTGSDFWLFKEATDVVVRGNALQRRPTPRSLVTLTVGRRTKRIGVVGPRTASFDGFRARFSAPDPFEQMPLHWERAYGGYDPRVPVPQPESPLDLMTLQADHPGLYPRNPNGRGYVVVPEACDDVALPNLEDPNDPLTPERFVVRDPQAWWKQPLPVCPDFLPMLWFPRYAHLGLDAWFPAPDDAQLPEVRLGQLPSGYRAYFDKVGTRWHDQEAVPDQRFTDLAPRTPFIVTGMDAEDRPMHFNLPPPPPLTLLLEGQRQTPAPRLTTVLVRPNERLVTLTYAAHSTSMHRTFVPGVHAEIPLALQVGSDTPIPYEAPEPLYPKIRDAMREL